MNHMTDLPLCPLSGESMRVWMRMPIDPVTGYPSEYGTVFYSDKSGYGMVFPRPSPGEIEGFYDLPAYYTHQHNQPTDSSPTGARPFWLRILDRLRMRIAFELHPLEATIGSCLRELPKKEFRHVLDVGCGAGGLMQELHQAGYSVVGIEQDCHAHSFQLGLPVYQGTAEVIPAQVQCQQFDAIIMSHVLEHCLDPIKALENLYQLLRPGGYFICEVPNNDCLGLKFAGVTWSMLDMPRHLNFFTPTSLVSMLEKIGLQSKKLAFRGYYRQFTNSWIDYEASVYDRLLQSGQTAQPWPRRNSPLRAWKLLLATIFAPPEGRYDSVRAIAQRPY